MKRQVLIIPMLFLSISCTKEYPLEPIYSDDTNWTPSIIVSQNGYQRIQLGIGTVPRQELLRNISSYIVTIKRSGDSVVVEQDTLSGTFSRLRPSNPPYYWSYFLSNPILEYNTDYSVQLAVQYRQGNIRTSSQQEFLTPLERGRVLKTIPLPSGNAYGPFDDVITFLNGSIMLLRGQGELFSIDTASGQSTSLTPFLFPPNAVRNISFLAASKGYVLAPYNPDGDWNRTIIMRFNPLTLVRDTSLVVDRPGWYVGGLAGDTGQVMILCGDADGRQRFISMDAETGDTLLTFPLVPWRVDAFFGMAFDGASIWVPKVETFNNTLISYNADDLGIIAEERNPVFQTHGLAWDGQYFWVIDWEHHTICKIQLGGL